MGYEPIANARFAIETAQSGEQIRIRAARQIFPMLFMPVWLAGWTAGGLGAIAQLTHHFEPFLVFWLCGWALGWVAVAG